MALEYLIAAIVVGAISFGSGLLPIYTKLKKVPIKYWLAFAAGVLLATAFFEMIPESFGLHGHEEGLEELEEEHVEISPVMFLAGGFFLFYLIENFIISRFHKEKYHEHDDHGHIHHTGFLGLFALAMDNIVDGAAIASSWLIDPVAGAIVSVAVLSHEIPHSFSTVSILRSIGADNKKIVLLLAAISSLFPITAFVVATTGIAEFSQVMAFTAGAFIYFGASHLLPESHEKRNLRVILSFLIGVIAIYLGVTFLH